jgi:hypothetical protein
VWALASRMQSHPKIDVSDQLVIPQSVTKGRFFITKFSGVIRNSFELKSLILAQIERWRHA